MNLKLDESPEETHDFVFPTRAARDAFIEGIEFVNDAAIIVLGTSTDVDGFHAHLHDQDAGQGERGG